MNDPEEMRGLIYLEYILAEEKWREHRRAQGEEDTHDDEHYIFTNDVWPVMWALRKL